jgi:RNase P/RNase MRP subunit p30
MNSINIISSSNIQEALNKIRISKKTFPNLKIGLLGYDEEFNQKALKIKGADILILNCNYRIENRINQRDSGLNESLCRLAKENNISIGINIEEIKTKTKKEKAEFLSLLRQNVLLCKKTKCNLVFLNGKDEKALFSLLKLIGADTKSALESISFLISKTK